MNLAYFLDHYGIPLVMVNPMHVKRSKELDDNLQTKNDKKDALVIARLMKDGRFSYPRFLKEIEAELAYWIYTSFKVNRGFSEY